jgi:Flp pilus assembly pilin Flp
MQNLKKSNGQGLVEYILIVVLMGILSIVAVKTLGTSTHKSFTKAASQLDGAFTPYQ